MKFKSSTRKERGQENRKIQQLGAAVRKLRQSRGWTQTQLARKAGLDQTYISSLEIGRRDPNPSYLSVNRIATALGTPPAALCARLGR